MTLVQLASLGAGIAQWNNGTVAPGRAGTIFLHDTSTPVTMYTDETGGTILSSIGTFVTDSLGHVPGWVTSGLYVDITIPPASTIACQLPGGGGSSGLGVTALGNVSGTTALAAAASGKAFTGTIVGNTTFSAPSGPAAGTECDLTLVLATDGTGGYSLTWFSGITWQIGAPGLTVVGSTQTVYLTSLDGGTTWLGSYGPILTTAMPWTVEIDPFVGPISNTNWATITTLTGAYGAVLDSSGAQNAAISWNVVLAAGTWTFSILTRKTNNYGIATVAIDGSTVGTIDLYAAGTVDNQFLSVAGIVIATTGKHVLSLTMASKNASSSSYFGELKRGVLQRTA